MSRRGGSGEFASRPFDGSAITDHRITGLPDYRIDKSND
ncbi:hypothetical protein C7S16_3357 [Burkholderia thailandensis]|uniref:Uncharacterized protein n=1 Tax=Burkholderia thailandensis TaxID=57975 RepID=A0AAW9D7E3_BURTH|nr:hypothetical protein [Burkholderia thailandensis]MDW9257758.1 hypothetical protein [Burkholderia thailandensis]